MLEFRLGPVTGLIRDPAQVPFLAVPQFPNWPEKVTDASVGLALKKDKVACLPGPVWGLDLPC